VALTFINKDENVRIIPVVVEYNTELLSAEWERTLPSHVTHRMSHSSEDMGI
jgi:hypothetical protein